MPVINLFPRRVRTAAAAARAVAHSFNLPATEGPPQPPRVWPKWATELKSQSLPGETGVGDTAERIIGPLGGTGFKEFYLKATGSNCNCTVRREGLNREFPYQV